MVPWHERVDFSHGPAVRNALERFGKPGLRIDAVHLAVCNKVAMVAQVLPPPSLPAKSAFFRLCKYLHKEERF